MSSDAGGRDRGAERRAVVRLARDLPAFLRHPLTASGAREILAGRLARRQQDFLAFARDAVYGHPASVYRQLLRHVGCELGDLERHDTDVIRVLETVLPARFGGGPTDYQLVEDETESGDPRVRLLVHPSVGPMDPSTVAEAFLSAIASGGGAERIMGTVWRDAGLLRVDRRPPFTGVSGKVLHVHVARPGRSPEASTNRIAV